MCPLASHSAERYDSACRRNNTPFFRHATAQISACERSNNGDNGITPLFGVLKALLTGNQSRSCSNVVDRLMAVDDLCMLYGPRTCSISASVFVVFDAVGVFPFTKMKVTLWSRSMLRSREMQSAGHENIAAGCVHSVFVACVNLRRSE